MIGVRRAGPEDAAEIVRLRRIMFAAMNGRDEPGTWERDATAMALKAARGGSGGVGLGAFVAEGDQPGTPHLAACAVGTVEERLPAPCGNAD